MVEWTEGGMKYEPDQRHAELIIRQLGLEEKSRSVVAPGVKQGEENPESDDGEELSAQESTMYRAVVARGIYLAQDRTDIQYAVKELSREMSKPTRGSWKAAKKLGRYLKGKERYVVRYDYQDWSGKLVVWTDTDYAGCRKTRKSTSGGVVCMGKHPVKAWSTTQNVIALSSGEAEYYGMVKGGSMGLGVQALLKDLGVSKGLKIKTDASAAKGIATRKGLGKVRHLEVNLLWLQDKVSKGEIEIEKIPGKTNRADALTKALGGEELREHIGWLQAEIAKGRHPIMPATTEKTSGEESASDQ